MRGRDPNFFFRVGHDFMTDSWGLVWLIDPRPSLAWIEGEQCPAWLRVECWLRPERIERRRFGDGLKTVRRLRWTVRSDWRLILERWRIMRRVVAEAIAAAIAERA